MYYGSMTGFLTNNIVHSGSRGIKYVWSEFGLNTRQIWNTKLHAVLQYFGTCNKSISEGMKEADLSD